MTAEDYATAINDKLCASEFESSLHFDDLVGSFRAAMAEERAQALRDAATAIKAAFDSGAQHVLANAAADLILKLAGGAT